jgi:hypothetical protein
MTGPIPVTLENAATVAQKVKAGELPGPAKSLAEAVCRVMEQVGYVQKDKQMMGGGSYKYVSIEAVIDKVRPEMLRQGLALLPVGVDPMHQGDHGKQCHLRVKYTFNLHHHPSGTFSPVVVIGEGMDVGDKAGNKAMTAARKAAMVMAFNIETGTDPDDTPSREQERAAPSQRDLALEAVRAAGDRKRLEHLYRDVQQDAKDGRLSQADAEEVFAAITHAAKKFPKPPEPAAPAKR